MELYAFPPSQPSRAVHMALEFYSLPYKYNSVNLLKGEHLEKKFVEMNPHHKIPVLVDGNFILTESRAILNYVAAKAEKEASCPKLRARLDEALYFDACTFTAAYNSGFVGPVIFGGKTAVEPAAIDAMKSALTTLDQMLEKSEYVVGKDVTVADLSILSTFSTLRLLDLIDTKQYPKVEAWAEKTKKLVPKYDSINEEGAKGFAELFKSKIA